MKIQIKFLLLPFLFIFLTDLNQANAQQLEDVVSLKNGSILRGDILEVTSQTLKIQIIGGSILVYKTEEIDKTWKEFPFRIKTDYKIKEKGYFNLTKIGLLVGGDPTGSSFITINGYQFNPHLLTGIGIGVEKYNFETFPLFAYLNYNFLAKRFSPFLSVQGGYSFVKKSDDAIKRYGGVQIGGELGIKSYFNENVAFYMSLGYRYQALSTKQTQQWWPTTDVINEITYKRFSISIGLLFN